MRLINTTTLQMHKQAPFASSAEKHKHAILSHRWLDPEEDEVTFQEMQSGMRSKSMRGYMKVRQFCELAERDGYPYAWVDTCCIDKPSSSELQEAQSPCGTGTSKRKYASSIFTMHSKSRIGIFVRLLRRYDFDEDHYIRVQADGKGFASADLIEKTSTHHTIEDSKILLCHSASLYGLDLDITHFAADLVNGFRIGPHLQKLMNGAGTQVTMPPRRSYGSHFRAGSCIKSNTFVWKHCGQAKNHIYAGLEDANQRVTGFILGFDLDFNPWCYVLEHDHKVGDIAIGDNKQTWDEETQYEPSNGSPRPMLAHRRYADFWRIKGARDSGLDVYLPSRMPRSWRSRRNKVGTHQQSFKQGSQWRISCFENGSSEPCRVTFALKPTTAGQSVWEFDIQNLYARQEHVEKFKIDELEDGVRERAGQRWMPDMDEIAALKDLGVTLHRVHDYPSWQWLTNIGRDLNTMAASIVHTVMPSRRPSLDEEQQRLLPDSSVGAHIMSGSRSRDSQLMHLRKPVRKRTHLELRTYPQRSSEDTDYDDCTCHNVSCIILDCLMWCNVRKWMGFDDDHVVEEDYY